MLTALLSTFLEKCTNINCEDGKFSNGYKCWSCNGTGKQLTQEGRDFFEFLKHYGQFAAEDHTHSIS